MARALSSVVQRSIGDKSHAGLTTYSQSPHVFRLRLIGAIAARIQV